jgi:tight adherence protein B
MGLLSFLFYKSVFAMLPMVIVGILFYKKFKKEKVAANRRILENQFKECILSVSTSLGAGYSTENAFKAAKPDMLEMFGEESPMVLELSMIQRGLKMNIPLEDLLKDLARRSGSGHLEQFSEVFEIAKRSGGSMSRVIKTTAELMARDIDARDEIDTVLSGKKMETNIMKLVPFGICLYISISSPGYFDSLYGNPKGILIMTICLVLYVAAYFMSEKILDKVSREV